MRSCWRSLRFAARSSHRAKKHRFRKLLIVLGIGGAVAAAYKWFSGKDADDQWQQAYQPDVGSASDGYAAAAPATEDPAAAWARRGAG